MNRLLPRMMTILAGAAALICAPASGAEPTDAMRGIARTLVALEKGDQPGYCEATHGPAYLGYLERACLLAVQNRVKKASECSTEQLAIERSTDAARCLALSGLEFGNRRETLSRALQDFITGTAVDGVDGAGLLRQERMRAPVSMPRETPAARAHN